MRLSLFTALLVFVIGCSGSEPWARTELYFGMDRADSTVISEREWAQFVAQQITNRFPDGLTVVNAQGQWRSRITNEIVLEPSRIVIFYYPPSPATEASIDSIRTIYRSLFHQEAVLKVTSRAGVSF